MKKTAKTAKPKAEETAVKKRGLAKHRRRRSATVVRARSNPSANPPAAADFVNVILPGFGAYALTRALARIAYSVVQKRWPRWGRHAYAATGAAAFAGSWFLAHRFDRLARYHDSILMGSGVGALQGVAQTYLPKKYNWLLGDPKGSDVAPSLPPSTTQPTLNLDDGEDDDEIAALSEATTADQRRLEAQIRKLEHSARQRRGQARAAAPPPAAAVDDDDDDLSSVLNEDEDVANLQTGVFAASAN